MITLLITLAMALPTIDGQRVDYGYHEPPYWLGFSVPPFQPANIQAIHEGEVLFTIQQGTEFNLAYIDTRSPITFYNHGIQIGQITPEPTTLISILTGILFTNKARQRIY